MAPNILSIILDGMGNRLVSKVALVTGAAGGIGSRMAALFAAEGASVVLADIADERGCRVTQEIQDAGGRATYIHADVTSSAEVMALMARTEAHFGGLDVLSTMRSISPVTHPITEVTEEVFDQTIAVFSKARSSVPAMPFHS